VREVRDHRKDRRRLADATGDVGRESLVTEAARTSAGGEATHQKRVLGPDPFLLTVTFLILTIGIVMVTSAGYIIASGRFGDGFYYAKKQGLAMAAGLALMFLFSRINPSAWKQAAFPLMGIGVLFLALVFVPGIGFEMGGAHRWIRLPFGLQFQPSEFIKYALIIFMAGSLAKKGDTIRDFAVGFLPHVLIMGIVVFLILMQPDFGSAMIITVVGFLMLFVAGVRLQHLLGSAILCLPFLVHFAMSAQYRLARLKTFMDPWSDPLNAGFQIIQSLLAFGCGGFWGAGIGKGIQKLYYLPQPHTDFIFAVVGEEMGFFGVLILVILFYLLICRGLSVSIKTADKFHKYLGFGITCLIGLQAFVNMAVAMGLLPTKGLPLPLVSLGGTSLVMNLAGLGILMAITREAQSRAGEEAP
jgi:cell division protein FtsW